MNQNEQVGLTLKLHQRYPMHLWCNNQEHSGSQLPLQQKLQDFVDFGPLYEKDQQPHQMDKQCNNLNASWQLTRALTWVLFNPGTPNRHKRLCGKIVSIRSERGLTGYVPFLLSALIK